MSVRRSGFDRQWVRELKSRRRRRLQNRASRQLQLENLEQRQLLAQGPELVAIQPNGDDLLQDGDVRHIAPTKLTFVFDLTTSLDPSTLEGGFEITRAGKDGAFGDANDVTIEPGFVGLEKDARHVVMRFSEPLVDDLYRVRVIGSGDAPLRDVEGFAYNDGTDTTLDFTLDLGAQVLAVVPQPVTRNPDGTLAQARKTIEVYFNDDPLDPAAAENPSFYQLIDTNRTITNTDDTVILPQTVTYDASRNLVTLEFADEFDPATYRLRIGSSLPLPSPPVIVDPAVETTTDFGTGGTVQVRFESDPQVAEQFGSAIQLRFTSENLGIGGLPAVRVQENLIFITLNSNGATPTTADQLKAALDGSPAASALLTTTVVAGGSQPIGTLDPASYSPIKLQGLGSSFNTATDLGTLTRDSQLIRDAISPQTGYPLDFPGAPDELGHRQIPEDVGDGFEQHVLPQFGADARPGVTTILYNFKDAYGVDAQGRTLFNLITEPQKQRAREALQMWSSFIGVEFLETDEQGITIVVGDPRALDPDDPNVMNQALLDAEPNAGFIVKVDPLFQESLLILDSSRVWDSTFAADWFRTAMIGIGTMLGLGRATDLPPSTLMAFASDFTFPGAPDTLEPIFPGNHDIVHGKFAYRPDSNDIDLYRFEIAPGQRGRFTAEVFAERQPNASLLDSQLLLFREDPETGLREIIAQNDDYYSEDSFIGLELEEGVYYLGISSSGNDAYTPGFENSGFGGTSQGPYELRVQFTPSESPANHLTDATGTVIDGDADGVPGGSFNFWFSAYDLSQTVFVDKLATGNRLGTLEQPYDKISDALAAAAAFPGGGAVRIVGNGGFDGDIDTLADNFAYELGETNVQGQSLADGATMAIPKDVSVQIDAGAILKLSNTRIGVGSSSLSVDRSGGSLQVLGTPERSVYFTSIFDETLGLDSQTAPRNPQKGDWGGIVFRNDLDNAEERFNLEDEGAFVNYVSNATIRYGGGNVDIDSVRQIVTPIQLSEARPTIINNRITLSADAAISADPDSFEETNFLAPRYQRTTLFTSDYTRVGPEIFGNYIVDNSINGLFVRIATPAGDALKPLTVPGRFDDTDIVHVIAENLKIQGTPGEPILELDRPPVEIITFNTRPGGSLTPGASYRYKIVFIDSNGFEGRPSEATVAVTLGAGEGTIRLDNLPPAKAPFVARRLYRSEPGGNGPFRLVAQLDPSDTTFIDDGSRTGVILQRDPPSVLGTTMSATGGTLAPGRYNYRVVFYDADERESGPSSDATASIQLAAGGGVQLDGIPQPYDPRFDTIRLYRSQGNGLGPYELITELDLSGGPQTSYVDDGTTIGDELPVTSFGVVRARTDARLAIDPGIVVKLEGARIETTFGSQFLAEGQLGREIIFTSKLDDRFGAGGTFDTNQDGDAALPSRGDWGGLYIGYLGQASIDHALLTFGGGINKIEGTFKGFNVLEIHQADVRLANSVIEDNADGTGGQGPDDRFGRTANLPATIFVRGSQPVIVDNIIQNNAAVPITIDTNSLNDETVADMGRSTGRLENPVRYLDNQGPVIRGNRLANSGLNGLDLRENVITAFTVWDDTDIVHVVDNPIIVPDVHTGVGLRIESSSKESLVVKFDGPADNFRPFMGAGIAATGRLLENENRIGGTVQIVGQPDFPVVLTSIKDDTIGAGLTPDGRASLDTNDDGAATLPAPGDWRSIRFEPYSNDRNVDVVLENESPDSVAPGENAGPESAQFLGDLAARETASDDNLRLGFQVLGQINQPADVDVYSFNATAGTEVWLDIDRTSPSLNTVVELIDADGNVIARSDDSFFETLGTSELYFDPLVINADKVRPLQELNDAFQIRHRAGQPKDQFSQNLLDAGFRVVLPGVVGTRSPYHVRVRSSSLDLDDLTGGTTAGAYELNVRLRELDEIPGGTVRYADIRYATNGVELIGVPYHSPLVGEVGEDEETGGPENNNQIPYNPFVPGMGPQDIGNLLETDRGTLSIGGSLSAKDDIDFYELTVDYTASVNNRFQHVSTIFDIDYADGLSRPDSVLSIYDSFGRLIFMGRDSNISDDRGGPLDGGDLSDLSRGSVGERDPYIGPIELPEGTYFVAVSSNDRLPDELTTNPLVRLEPINSIARVAEDHFEPVTPATLEPAKVTNLFDEASIVSEPVDELTWFISGGNGSQLVAVNPQTGVIEQRIGGIGGGPVGDIAIRPLDGSLHAFRAQNSPLADDTAGNYLDINTSNGQEALDNGLDDGIITFEEDTANPGQPIVSDVGVHFNAMAFGELDGQLRLFGVGNRGDWQDPPPGPEYFTNLLYQFDPMTGLAISDPLPDRTADRVLEGAGTQIVERAFFNTAEPAVYPEVEPNDNNPSDAQDLEILLWSYAADPWIGDATSNTSTRIPHITIEGTGDDTADVYRFAATGAGKLIIDIDGTTPGFDSKISLYGGGVLLGVNDDAPTSFGAGGSTTSSDAYLELGIPGAGIYYIVVEDAVAGGVPAGAQYTLQVSLEDHFADRGAQITGLAFYEDTLYAVSDAAQIFRVEDPLGTPSLTKLQDFRRDVVDPEGNTSLPTALSLEQELWTLSADPNIADSTTVPHISVVRPVSNTTEPDFFSFESSVPDAAARFDIDFAGDAIHRVTVYNSAGTPIDTVVGNNPDLTATLPLPGTYYVSVVNVDPTEPNTYKLNISVAGHDAAFSGLATRDRFLDNGPYTDRLFALGTGGRVYSLDLGGNLVTDVFGGVDRIDTGVTGANGIDFSQPNLWHPTWRRADDLGHGQTEAPDDSRGNMSRVPEIEPNNTIAEAHDLEDEFWNLGYNSNIGDAGGNTSTVIPHVSIDGSGDNSFDYYIFDVIIPPDDDDGVVKGIFDIDITFDEQLDPTGVFDAELYLFDASSGALLASNQDSNASLGDQGSTSDADPFLEFDFDTNGTYAILVTGPLGTPVQVGDFYTLQVSLEEHRVDGPRANGGISFYFGHERVGNDEGDYDEYQRAVGSIRSYPFSLEGYSSADRPTLYFNYYSDLNILEDIVEVYVEAPGRPPTRVAAKDANILNDPLNPVWRQARVPLDQFAGLKDLRLRIDVVAPDDIEGDLEEGFFVDDFIIGFAERGEMVTMPRVNPSFRINPENTSTNLTGEYQLEIRQAADIGTSQVPDPTLVLNRTLDTNARMVQQFSLVAPSGADLAGRDGLTFTIGDGVETLTFEFDDLANSPGVSEGAVRVGYLPTDSAARVAASIRDAVNSSPAQTVLDVTAGLADGTNTGFDSTSQVVNLYGNAIVGGYDLVVPDGLIQYDLSGDRNLARDQGQMLVHSNFITDYRDWGIVADAGPREFEPRVPHGFLETHPGAVRKLRELNNSPEGGLVPGATIENNVIAGEGLGGIFFSGARQPYEMTTLRPAAYPRQNVANATAGDRIVDGTTFSIRMDRTVVTFEFEDIGAGNLPAGSRTQAGNGWRAGNIPIFYRRTGAGYLNRTLGYTQTEMATAIRDAIQGSILVTNGSTQRLEVDQFFSRAWGTDIGGPDPAVFLSDTIEVLQPNGEPCTFNSPAFPVPNPCGFSGRFVSVAEAPQPFGRILNNTIYGSDGDASFFAGSGLDEPNDILEEAVATKQGRSQNPDVYVTSGVIGDGNSIPADQTRDVDFYKLHLRAGERVIVDVDANETGSPLDAVLRLFDAAGNELVVSQDDPAPGEAPSLDPYIDFTATERGTYYVGVSGAGNEVYEPIALANRNGPASTGDYTISVDVRAPRRWIITAVDGSQIADGTTFQVSDINTTVTYEFDDALSPGVQPGNIPIPYNSTPIPANGGQRGPGYRPPEMAVVMAATIGQGLTGVTARALGGVQGRTDDSAPAQTPGIFPDTIVTGIMGFGHDTPFTGVRSSTELYVVIEGASRVTGSVDFIPLIDDNLDELLPETGILVSDRASPTLLNNALSNLESGVIQISSPTTVEGGSLYQNIRNTDSNIGARDSDFNISLDDTAPMFVNAPDYDFYPAPGARIIDSAVDSLEERDGFARVKNAMGIGLSPILAPERDAVGLLRADDPDVASPSGQGANVFKDRGGLDRADFQGPDAVLISPLDNDAAGVDLDPTRTVVHLGEGVYSEFVVQLVDGFGVSDAGEGVGIDDNTVSSPKVTITENGRLLEEGVDYLFEFSTNSNSIRLTPIRGLWNNDKVYVIRLNNRDIFVIDMPDGGMVRDGQTFLVMDQTLAAPTFEFESGYSMYVPESLSIFIPEAGADVGGIQDGERFTVSDGLGQFTTFEFDMNVPPNTLPGNVRIDVSQAVTQDEVAGVVVDTINNANIGMTAVYLGSGRIHLGAAARYQVDTTNTQITQSGLPGAITDGQSFTIDTGTRQVTYEFDSDGVWVDRDNNGVPDNVLITFTDADPYEVISDRMAAAVANSGLGLPAQHFGLGHVYIGGEVGTTLDASSTPRVRVEGQPGVQPSTTIQVPLQGAGPGGIADGQTFTISNGLGVSVTFEFDNNNRTASGNQPILFSATTTVNQFAEAIISAIKIAPLGLDPDNLGGGVIRLNDTVRHSTDVLNTALTRSGVPGGAIPVRFVPDASFTSAQMLERVEAAIAASPLTGVQLERRGGNTFFVEGAEAVSGIPNFYLGAIKDTAKNSLRANQPDGEMRFTILMPGTELDFGDAPDAYPDLLVDNGARHVVSSDLPIFLGSGVTADSDGQPSPLADADQDDGVDFGSVLNRYTQTPIFVTASAPGYLSAWIDYNADGDWEDPGEYAIKNVELTAGVNELEVGTPAFAPLGFTNARFRFSTQPDLAFTGVAPDGEVEDYRIEVRGGRPPVANDDAATTDEDTVLDVPAIGLLANDSDPDGDALQIFRPSSFVSSLGATVEIRADGSYRYDPTTVPGIQSLAPGDQLVDQFTYRAQDAYLPSNKATVTITVQGANDAPVAVDDEFRIDEDSVLQVSPLGVLANDSDIDQGDSLLVQAANLTSTLGAAVSLQANGGFSYDPRGAAALQSLADGAEALDTFTYTVVDSYGATSTATVTIRVAGRNDAPTAQDDAYSANEDVLLSVDAANGLLANDSDIDGDSLSVRVAASDSTSALGAPITYQTNGAFTYDPTGATALQQLPAGGSTIDTFSYRIADVHGAESTASLAVTVQGENDVPVARADSYATFQNRVLFINRTDEGLLANDSDIDRGDTIQVDPNRSDTTSTKGATITIFANGTFAYDPTQSTELALLRTGEKTNDTFSYTVVDSLGATDTVTVTVEVTGVNSAPITGDDLYSTNEDSVLSVTDPSQGVLANDRDPEGDPITLVSADSVSTQGAAVMMNANGTFTYDPLASAALQALNVGDTLEDVFRYVVRDPQGNESTGTVKVTVSGLNDAPFAQDDSYKVLPDQAADLDVAANDSDIDGTLDRTSIVIVSAPANGSAIPQADGTVRYTPNSGFSGSDQFTYQIRDNSGTLSNVATVDINVNAPPVAVDDQATAYSNGSARIAVLANDSDPDGQLDPASVTLVRAPSNGRATVQPDGTVVYVPSVGFLGSDSFSYTVADDDGDVSNEATVDVVVVENPFPHQNPLNRLDVNADGFVSPLDALVLINELNENGSRDLPVPPTPPDVPPPYLDPSGDNQLTPRDPLEIINFLNNGGSGEGEAAASQLMGTPGSQTTRDSGGRDTTSDARDVLLRGGDVEALDLPLVGEAESDAGWQLRGVLAGQADWHSDSLEDTLNDIVDDVNWDDLELE